MQDGNGPNNLGSIQILTGPSAGNIYPINKTPITVGREPENDIIIDDPSVSRHHAQIAWNNGTWIINKLAAQNTVTVNSRNIDQATIVDHDTIGLGAGTTFLFLTNPAISGAVKSSGANVAPVQQAQAPVSPVSVPPNAEAVSSQPLMATIEVPKPDPAHLPPVSSPPSPVPDDFNTMDGSNELIPSIEVSTNIHHEKPTYQLDKQMINIGRDPSNDIVIEADVVSGFHVQIVNENNQYILIHPHPSRPRTTNGLFYQGRHISGTELFRHPLTRGDIFRIGDGHGTLVTLTYDDGSGTPHHSVPEIHPIELGASLITIGRQSDNMVVPTQPNTPNTHAELRQEQGSYRIVDLNSTNHVYVNGQRVSSQLLNDGDEVRIGPFKLAYTGKELLQHDELCWVCLVVCFLKKTGSKQTILINDISLAIPPRKFVAVVGGSGTGKSTLMDGCVWVCLVKEGAVLYNGTDYYHHLAAFSTQLGYVPQDDIIHRDLTVERALYYAAKMRLPDDFTEQQIKQRVDEVLEDVEMSFRRKLLVSKLSGGQRKRVSIALELLANPSIFFLDEPTSGLDPGLDRKMMFLLRKLADKGHTIILITHATNNINVCDYICFLAQGGRLAYFGPPNDAKTFFGKTDFAAIYNILEPTDENKNIPDEAEAKYKASLDYQKYVVEPLNSGPAGRANILKPTEEITRPKRGNPWKQFRLLAIRYLELLWNDKGNLAILLLQAPIIALILFFLAGSTNFATSSVVQCNLNRPGLPAIPVTVASGDAHDCQNVRNAINTPQGQLAIRQSMAQNHTTKQQAEQQAIDAYIVGYSGGDAQTILFVMAFAAVMFGCINGAREIVKEAPIYRRERTVNLGIMPYMFSKIAVLGVLCLLQSAVLVWAVNAKAPFHWSIFLPSTVEIYITMALTSLVGLMIGLLISALAPNNDRATSLIPLILIPQVIFSGPIFNLDNYSGLQVLGGFFAARWAMAGMGSSTGLHGDRLGVDSFSYHGTLFSAFTQSEAVMHLLLVWFMLIVMIVVLGLLIGVFLKQKDVRV